MQFNAAIAAGKDYQTTHATISAMYKRLGYTIPNIVYWNLRPNITSFPATTGMPGVALLSGFSSDLLKLFMQRIEFTPMSNVQGALRVVGYSLYSGGGC